MVWSRTQSRLIVTISSVALPSPPLPSPSPSHFAREKVCTAMRVMEPASRDSVANPCSNARISRNGTVPSSSLHYVTNVNHTHNTCMIILLQTLHDPQIGCAILRYSCRLLHLSCRTERGECSPARLTVLATVPPPKYLLRNRQLLSLRTRSAPRLVGYPNIL